MAATSLCVKKLLASSLLTKSQFACNSLAAAASPSPLSDPISTPGQIRLASPFFNGIGGGVRRGWEAKRSYTSIFNGLGGKEEDVKVQVPVKKKNNFTKICMLVKTFENKNSQDQTFPACQHKISLPTKRFLLTVLRSPHIDKKSREQFFFTTKKQHLVIQAQRHELANKYFWLKRHRIMGAQFEVKFFCKTRFQTDWLNDSKLYDSRESKLQIEPAPALASI